MKQRLPQNLYNFNIKTQLKLSNEKIIIWIVIPKHSRGKPQNPDED